MELDDRRRAMLREMGVHWPRPPGGRKSAAPSAGDLQSAPVAAPPAGPPSPGASLLTATPAPSLPPAPQRPSMPPASRPAPEQAEVAPPRPALEPSAVTALDWPALREAVASCRACGLCETRRQTVFGVGHPRAHWMVVGEAPGEQEDLQGEPFVGAAGQLLDAMLRSLGLTRAEAAPEGEPPLSPERQVYIANTLKCRPPRNRNPEREELARCEPFLVRQIQLVQPRLILAMGRFAVQALLRTEEPIGRLRGRVHRYEGVPLVVTYHPAYLLRNLADKARAWEDLCLAAQVMDGDEGAA